MPIRYNPLPPHFQYASTGGGGSGILTINLTSPNVSNNFTIQAGPGIDVIPIAFGTQILANNAIVAYTNVTNAMSPYTVIATDSYISVDCSAGAVTLNFPNTPTSLKTWVVKDRTGNALANNITLTTPGATDLFDGSTTYLLDDNYEAIQVMVNPSLAYELF